MTNTMETRHPLGIHNTYWVSTNADNITLTRNKEAIVHPFMAPLIEALQLKRPSWEFEARGYGGSTPSTDQAIHSAFYIYDNGEELCRIDRGYVNGAYAYEARSPRISAKRHIGLSKRSKNLKTIASEILKQVYPLTLDEIANKQYSRAYDAAQQVTHSIRREHSSNLGLLSVSMLAYLSSGGRWSEFEAAIDTPAVMQAKARHFSLTEDLRAAADINKDHTVLVERPRDIVVKPVNGAAYSSSLEALPDHMKTSLALLKMSDVNTLVNGVGVRVEADTFYIINREEV